MSSHAKEYRTTDIVLAAFLRLEGIQMSGIEKNGQRGTFIFVDVPYERIKTYDLGTALVEPVAFNNAIKSLTTSVRRLD